VLNLNKSIAFSASCIKIIMRWVLDEYMLARRLHLARWVLDVYLIMRWQNAAQKRTE